MQCGSFLIQHWCHLDFAQSSILLQPLQLTGHHGEVSALAFGQRSRPTLLCSASADYIIVWDIEECQRKTQKGQNNSHQPDLHYTDLLVQWCSTIQSWVEDTAKCISYVLAGDVAAGTVIGTLLGKVVHLSFCTSDQRVAACSGTTVHILSLKAWIYAYLYSWSNKQEHLFVENEAYFSD